MQAHRHPATERAGYSKEGRWIKNYIAQYLLYIVFELKLQLGQSTPFWRSTRSQTLVRSNFRPEMVEK